jgi:uncharacterized membrane protein (DUF2068 family)
MKPARSFSPRAKDCPPHDQVLQHLAGLRAVALLEMFKGLLVFAAGIGLFSLLHKDIGDIAENIVEHLHLNPAHHIARVFIQAANGVSDKKVVAMACAAFAYTVIRFVEAYGLWNARAWAEWFAIVSGSLYLPWEILEVAKHDNRVRWALLIVNILVVLYMIYVRWDTVAAHRSGDSRRRALDYRPGYCKDANKR